MRGKEEKERAARNCPKLTRIARRPLEAGLDNSWKVPHYMPVSLGNPKHKQLHVRPQRYCPVHVHQL